MIYSAIVLPWQAPDEPPHFEYVKLLYEKRRLITGRDHDPSLEKEIIASMDKYDYWRFGFTTADVFRPGVLPEAFREIWSKTFSELHQPPLAYLVYTIPLFVVPTSDIAVQLYAMRLVSVFIGTAVVLIAFLVMKELFPNDDFLIIGVPAFITFLPMHTFMTSCINNDHLTELLFSLLILILVKGFQKRFSILRITGVTLTIALALLSKRIAIIAVPICVTALFIYLWGAKSGWLRRWGKVVLITAVIAVVVGMGMGVGRRLRTMLIESFPGVYYHYLGLWPPFSLEEHEYLSSEALRIYRGYVEFMFQSFWALFGWGNIVLDTIWYQTLAILSLVAFAGLCLFVSRVIRRPNLLARWQRQCLLLFFVGVIVTIIFIFVREIRNWVSLPGSKPQGRYLFPLIIAVATFLMIGLRELVPVRYRKSWLVVFLGGLILLDSICLIHYIIPFFYV